MLGSTLVHNMMTSHKLKYREPLYNKRIFMLIFLGFYYYYFFQGGGNFYVLLQQYVSLRYR